MKKKVSISSWAIAQPLNELCEGAKNLGFDGISLGGFPPYGASPDVYNTPEKIAELKKMFADNGLEVADYAIDLWSVDSIKQTKEWFDLYEKFIVFAKEVGYSIIRVDTGTPPILPEGMTYEQVKEFFIKSFKKMAQRAAKDDLQVVWEFEPGFIINEPVSVIEVVKAVDEKNFSLLFDTCHAYNCANGARHIQKGKVLDGGIYEFIDMAKDLIGLVHVIDSDGTLNNTGTSTHTPFGEGNIDFDKVIPAILDRANYKGDWWAIDLCEWPNAWKVTEDCIKFVEAFNEKFCK